MKKIIYCFLLLNSFIGFSQILDCLDTSFGDGGVVSFEGYSADMLLQSDDKFLVLSTSNNDQISLVRFLSNGSVDSSFNAVIPASSSLQHNMAIQLDGKIIIITDSSLSRFNTDGTIDTSFGNNGYIENCFQPEQAVVYYSKVAVDPISGNIIVCGGFSFDQTRGWIFACYSSNGSLNTSFNGNGFKTLSCSINSNSLSSIKKILIDSSGRITAIGCTSYTSNASFSTRASDNWMCRLNGNGSMDLTFSDDGIFVCRQGSYGLPNFDCSWDMVVKPNGSTVVAGEKGPYYLNKDFSLYEVTADGTLVNSAMPLGYDNPNSFIANACYQMGMDSNGKYILGGFVDSYADPKFGILRLNPDYSIDTAFGVNGWISAFNQNYNYTLQKLAVQNDNKILVLGNSGTQTKIYRYLSTTNVTLNTESNVTGNRLKIFPNPVNIDLNIIITDNSLLDSHYQIVDLNGRLLDNGILTNVESKINIEKLSKGIYFLKIEKQNLVQKFIKQ